MATIYYVQSERLLEAEFALAEEALLKRQPPRAEVSAVEEALGVVFASSTQAYREVLLGCTLAKLLDASVNIRQPYVDQGPDAFSGRSLDERVVNPFLQRHHIPSSRGPYLSCFRRSVQFNNATRGGLRDKRGYDALLALLDYIEKNPAERRRQFLTRLLYRFVELREEANIALFRLQRISLEQYEQLMDLLLALKSGGVFPVLMVAAMFRTICSTYSLDWEVSFQHINVADKPSGAEGDIVISSDGKTILAVEVTERHVGRARVVATFNTKIAPSGLEDYLFVTASGVDDDAKAQARRYFAQGHEVNFVDVREWILMLLSTMGRLGRATYNQELMAILEEQGIPKALRVAWNESVNQILSGE